jgi:hypothetical protein
MTQLGWLDLRDRRFPVASAQVIYHPRECTWQVEIHASERVHGGETWRPYLYHQGLSLPASTPEQLVGQSMSWKSLRESSYPHPELGLLYVFGHHDVYDCTLMFGALTENQIELVWQGLCQVYWDDDFGEDVPLRCECKANVELR